MFFLKEMKLTVIYISGHEAIQVLDLFLCGYYSIMKCFAKYLRVLIANKSVVNLFLFKRVN